MDFNELLALLREPGEDGVPDTIYDDLSSSYALAVDGGAASVAQAEAVNAELTAEINRLKALNFDLLMAASGDTSTDETEDAATEPIGDPSIDDLFDRD